MSAIRERTVLCFIDLPKKLTSRRNLLAYFSKFGEIQDLSVNKDLKTGMINFSSHFEAQTAKTQGKVFEGKPLNIFWSESSTLDPRAKVQEHDTTQTEHIWQDDDKECFGVESLSNSRAERKHSAKDMITHHLKLPTIKNRLGVAVKTEEASNTVEIGSKKSPNKLVKVTKAQSHKRSLINQLNKSKLVRKEGKKTLPGNSNQKSSMILVEQASKSTTSFMPERTDLKHKLTLLDVRDKSIRKETVHDSNIKTATAIKGTCPDMCPERERILRQCGHAVATYEMFPGTYEMDENRAVKEYIRSSADQEVPLPHDLRPEPVLSMTMNYLITSIINRVDDPDENKAIWYSFCWNRLRSIRKDIILQQLCDLETVKIVEQCARFHITCYDHMWGAEVSGFDDKINTQNLIDCLQTLRHMYEDLAQHNVSCPNEAEFYSYLILLKLKSGDVMWEYQQYSSEIQLSPCMQFAIEAYMVFKNNMYARYFNLVKKASYLTACLMQRYFDIVRTQALKIMLKAYCLPGKTVGLTSSFLVSSLKFDSQKNALRFCEREEVDIKIDCDEKGLDVYVSTSSFLIKEKRIPIANAVVGEGNPMPVYVPHQVHYSFDECGKLKDSLPAVFKEPDFSEESPCPEEEPTKVNIPDVVPVQPVFKFSLSPAKEHVNIFNSTLFSTEETLDSKNANSGGYMKIELSHTIQSNQDSSEALFSSNKTMEVVDMDSVEMEEDFEHPISIDNNEIHQRVAFNSNLSETFPVESSNFQSNRLQQPVSIPIFTPNKTQSPTFKEEDKSTFSQNNYFPIKVSQDIIYSKSEHKHDIAFSFIDPKNEPTMPFSFDYSHHFSNSNFDNLNEKNVEFREIKSTVVGEKEEKKTADYAYFTSQKDENFSQEQLKQSHIKDVIETSQNNKAEVVEATKQALILEKLLREKAEEDRLKTEEIKRLKSEEMRKRIEEKKILQNLKKDLRERLKAISARKCGRQWKEKVKKLKQSRADFPMLIQLSVNNHLSLWGTVSSVPINTIFERAKDKKNSINVTSQLLQSGITDSCRYISSDLAESLAQFATKTMQKGVVKPVFWKLGVSVPWTNEASTELSVFDKLMKRWCRQSFYKKHDAYLGSVESVVTSIDVPVNISIHFCEDLHSSHDLQGMNALLFIILNESESQKMCLKRLKSLSTYQVRRGKFSIAVMNIGGNKLEQVLMMELKQLQEQNCIAHWKINNWSSPESIMESLIFLAEHINVVPHICASPLDLLIKQISEEFFDALSSSQYSCVGLMDAVKNPNSVIQLYNTLLTKVEDLLISSKLEKYFDFAEEFKNVIPQNESGGPELLCGQQYDHDYKHQVSKKIHSLKLPEFSKWPPKSPNRLLKMLKSYCNEVHDISTFPQIIRILDLTDDSNLLEQLRQVSWLNIIEIWVQCIIRYKFSSREKSKRMFVVFNKNDIQRMIKKQWWLKSPVVLQFTNCGSLT